jgi:hypothetical protein
MVINPASSGWIHKYISLLPVTQSETQHNQEIDLYHLLVQTGFFYGVSSQLALLPGINSNSFSIDDYTKVNLFTALMLIYKEYHPQKSIEDALPSIEKFYKSNNKGKTGIFSRITFSRDIASNVEAILAARLQESNPIIKKGSSTFFTYILVSIDIIAFHAFIREPEGNPESYAHLEFLYNKVSYVALNAKQHKTKYDLNIVTLFKDTFTAIPSGQNLIKSEYQKLSATIGENKILKKQLINLCLLAIFDDKEIDSSELSFLYLMAKELAIDEVDILENIEDLHRFKVTYGKKVRLFNYANPVKHFYKETYRTVKVLILKNGDRILKELVESKELVLLLGQSTLRDLNLEEKKKVKKQLLDICKTIPSLTIFIIPGGSLLLPLLIKLIPKLLPSAFNENRIEK